MATDIAITWDNTVTGGVGDFSLDASGDLASGNDLASAVYVSLFSDRLVDENELPAGQTDRRGWYGDTQLQIANRGDLIGSRLWLLERAKSDDHVPLIARAYIREALAWMIADGVASSIDATCYFIQGDQERLAATIEIFRFGQQRPDTLKFQWAWRQVSGVF